MKKLIFILIFIPILAKADQAGFGVGIGQNSMPMYGTDYKFADESNYVDFAAYGNKQTFQPYLSTGWQGSNWNFGLAFADNLTNVATNTYNNGPLGFGLELGYKQDLLGPLYVKENNSYLDFGGNGSYFSSILSIGFNL